MVVVVLPTPPFWLHIDTTRAGPWVATGGGSGNTGIGRPVGPSSAVAAGGGTSWGAASRVVSRGVKGRGSLSRVSARPDGPAGSEASGGTGVRPRGGISGAADPEWDLDPNRCPPVFIWLSSKGWSLTQQTNKSTRRHADDAPGTLGLSHEPGQDERRLPPGGAQICGGAVVIGRWECTGATALVQRPVDGPGPRSGYSSRSR